jgi:hypothetical protein
VAYLVKFTRALSLEHFCQGITPEVPPPATKMSKNPVLAWGSRNAAVYEIAHELDVVPWKQDHVLLNDARNLGIRTLVRVCHNIIINEHTLSHSHTHIHTYTHTYIHTFVH